MSPGCTPPRRDAQEPGERAVVLPFRSGDAPPRPRIDLTTIEVRYRHEQTYGSMRDQAAQTWDFTAHAHLADAPVGADPDAMVHLGQGEAVLVGIHSGRNPVDALDEHSEEAKEIAEIVFDPATGEPRRDFSESLEGFGSHLLVLVDLTVEPAWRGQRLGPVIAGFAIEALSPSAFAVVCRPEPAARPSELAAARYDHGEHDGGEHDTVGTATSKLQALAGLLGFELYRDGVLVLDTATVTFSAAFEQLLSDAHTAPSEPSP